MTHRLSLKQPRTILALTLALSLLSVYFIASSGPASAATSVSQCNGTDNVGARPSNVTTRSRTTSTEA
jgi:hypothetical protein